MTNRKRRKPINQTPWYPYAMAGCIMVILYVTLTHLSGVWSAINSFIGYFKPVILGCIIAYIINPLGKLLSNRVFKFIKKDGARNGVSNIVAFILIVGLFILAIMLMVPQLIDSIRTFANNLDNYVARLIRLLENNAWASSFIDVDAFIASSENLLTNLAKLAEDNIDTILSTGLDVGASLVNWAIALILSIYLLAEKNKLKGGITRLMQASFKPATFERLMDFFRRSNVICNRYIVFNLIDSLIVGIICVIFMTALGMPYAGLVAFIVGITNLIPTFGPVIGAAAAAFILLMAKPSFALIFVIFAVVLQIFDGYILKPRLFGDSLGISGLWILIAVIVGGSMFGIVGMLLAIPGIAISDFCYKDYLLPAPEKRRPAKDAAAAEAAAAEEAADAAEEAAIAAQAALAESEAIAADD